MLNKIFQIILICIVNYCSLLNPQVPANITPIRSNQQSQQLNITPWDQQAEQIQNPVTQQTAQSQEAQQPSSAQQNPVQTIVPETPELRAMDDLYDKNPIARSLLEKLGLKKKTEIKFDNKTGQTRVVTTYPSGKVTLQTSSLPQTGDGIPLTNKMISKHQNVISSVDNVLPVLEKIKNLDSFPLWSIPNAIWGHANESAVYSGLVNQALDSLMGAFGMPTTDKGLASVKDQLEIHHLEGSSAYKDRIETLIKDLKREGNIHLMKLNNLTKYNQLGGQREEQTVMD